MNAEVFAKGFEKCRLLTRLPGQNVENLDDYGCPKIQSSNNNTSPDSDNTTNSRRVSRADGGVEVPMF